jgi:hypothetical protein
MDHPLSGARAAWEAVIEDRDATAAEYREAGWEVVALDPGDVTPLPPAHDPSVGDGRVGLDVLVPGDQFRDLRDRVADVTFDTFDAFRAEQGSLVFLVLAMKSAAADLAVLVPLYYDVDQAREMLARAAEAGTMRTFVRPLSDEERVVFEQDDPTPLFPAGAEADGDDGVDGAEADGDDGVDGDGT